MNLSDSPDHPTGDERSLRGPVDDPDASAVASARNGDMAAFEALVRSHQGRVYRTLMGVTGNAEDSQDGTQAVFIKVFRKLQTFTGEARFSTWLTRIAINEGLERLRSRRHEESLDERPEEDFRPSNLQPGRTTPKAGSLARKCADRRGGARTPSGALPGRRRPARHRAALGIGGRGRSQHRPAHPEDAPVARPPDAARSAGGAPGHAAEAGRCIAAKTCASSCRTCSTKTRRPACASRSSVISPSAGTCQVLVDSTRKTLTIVTEAGRFELPTGLSDRLTATIMEKVRGGGS